ncbi:MAG: substrate-binding domain-containing protein [Caldilineaceae bacterium]
MYTSTENFTQQLRKQGVHVFQYLVTNSVDAILMTNATLEIAYANYACSQLIGRTIIGQPLRSLWYEDDLPLLETIVESAQVGSFFSVARLSGFYSVVDRYPGIEIVGRLAANWNRELGRKAAEKILRANPPGTLDVIWAASGEMAMGALTAVEAAERQAEVKIVSNDGTPESVIYMNEGRLLAETHHGFADWGWYGTKLAVMLALGQPVPRAFDIRPRLIYQANTAQFYPTPALEAIDWATIKADRQMPDKITIGWIQAVRTGVFQTATEYFNRAAADAREHGIPVEVITRIPDPSNEFTGSAAIMEEYIAEEVDVIALSTVKVEVIRQAIKKANAAGIPVIIVNQLEPIEGVDVACYIGFDNTVAGLISGYAVVDYLGGPGVLGSGNCATVMPDVELDLAWWQALYQDVNPTTAAVKGRVAIIEGISGSWQGEHRLVRSNEGAVYVDTVTFPVHDKSGQFLGIAAAFRDATLRKQTEETAKAYAERLEAMVETRTHDLQRAYRELQHENLERRKAEAEKEHTIQLLQEALTQVKRLSGLFPICASGKKIRDDDGYWHQVEVYIRDHSEADFSHSICPECRAKLYPKRGSSSPFHDTPP